MAEIHASLHGLRRLVLEHGESFVIGFRPDGANTHGGSKVVEFEVYSITLPAGNDALSIGFPDGLLYRDQNGRFILLDDPTGAEEMTITWGGGTKMRLRRFGAPKEILKGE